MARQLCNGHSAKIICVLLTVECDEDCIISRIEASQDGRFPYIQNQYEGVPGKAYLIEKEIS